MPFNDSIRIGASGATGFNVARSLRFNSADNAYLERTVSTTSSRTTFTYSCWVKRTNITTAESMVLMGSNLTSGTAHTAISFDTNDTFALRARNPVGGDGATATTTVFRDPTAWMHVMYVVDTPQVGVQTVRQKVFVNGVEQPATVLTTHLVNSQLNINLINTRMAIGAVYYNGTNETDRGEFYLAEVNYVDGLALTPASFTETDVLTGQLIPKKYVGAYGTNGYRLTFSDNSSVSALGTDTSGNGNNLTPNNFATTDAVLDTPTNNFCTLNPIGRTNKTESEGNLETKATGNAWRTGSSTFHMSSGKWYWEVHITAIGSYQMHGIVPAVRGNFTTTFNADVYPGSYSNEWGYRNNGILYNNASGTSSWGATYTNGDILSFALDMDNGTLDIKKNNVATGSQITGISGEYRPAFTNWATTSITNVNFGQDSSFAGEKTAQGNKDSNGQGDFYYAPPSGYLALCSANLPTPPILLPEKYFETLLYTGNGTTNAITGLEFSPDLVWLKRRSGGNNGHRWFDVLRGPLIDIRSDSTAVNSAAASALSSFDSNGFTVINDDGNGNLNNTPFVAWNWDAGATDGKTYTVTVVASGGGNKFRFDGFAQDAVTLDLAEGGTYIFNYPSGHPFRFSTVADGTHGGGSEYTTGVTEVSTTQIKITVAASAPQLYYYCSIHSGMGGAINTNSTQGSSNFDGALQSIVKVNQTAGFSIVKWTSGGSDASVGHGLGVKPAITIQKRIVGAVSNWSVYYDFRDGSYDYIRLNLDSAHLSSSASVPTSSVFYQTYGSGTMIGYCFSEVAGYSKFGVYKGNGSTTDGAYVHTGFRPALVIIKANQVSGVSWNIYDNKRDPDNLVTQLLRPNLNTAESTGVSAVLDFLANGFKLRGSAGSTNASSREYIYFAFAESPFKNSRAR